MATGASNMTAASEGDVGQEQLASTPLPDWTTKLDVFQLKPRSELVFSGDAGVTSPSGSTTRTGIEWGNA